MPRMPGTDDVQRVTIRDVAALAGVSTSAVSHTFNGRADISSQTRERILAAAQELNWRPAAAALALAAARNQTVGYIVRRDPDRVRSDPFFVDILAGMQSALAATQHSLLVRIVATEEEELEAHRGLVQRRQVDGLVLVDHHDDDPRYPLIRRAGIPAVAIGRAPSACPFPVIASDPVEQGIRDAVRMLAELGHRRIAYVSGPVGFAYTTFRQRRIEAAATELGLLLETRASPFERPSIISTTQDLLAATDRPTAIFYSNDWMALWGAAAAQELGLSVPGDLSVIGHDDAPIAAMAHPALATVREDVLQLADAAARTLLALIEREPLPDVVQPPTEFLSRETVAAPPTGA